MPATLQLPTWLAPYRTLFAQQDALLMTAWQHFATQAAVPFSLDKQLRQLAPVYQRLQNAFSAAPLADYRARQLQQHIQTALQNSLLTEAERLHHQLVTYSLERLQQLPGWRRQRWLRRVSRWQADFGLLHLRLGNHCNAARQLMSAIEHLPDNAETSHLSAIYHNEAGYALYLAQDYPNAERLYAQALRLSQQTDGELHLETAISLNNLGLLKAAQGAHADAEMLYRRALDTQALLLGKYHPSYALTSNNLACLYASQSLLDKAALLFLHSLHVRTQVLGLHHPDTQLSQHNLAWLHSQQQRPAQAEALYQNLIEQRRASLGELHPDTLTAQLNLAAWYRQQGRKREAQALSQQAQHAQHNLRAELAASQIKTGGLLKQVNSHLPLRFPWKFWRKSSNNPETL